MTRRIPRAVLAAALTAVPAVLALAAPARADEPRCSSRPVVVGVNALGVPDFDRVRDAHLGWVRLTVAWSAINPEPGVWRFADLDRDVAAARRHGVEVLALLSHTPVWAGGGPHGTVPPDDLLAWSDFVRRLARRYGGRIAAYEVWNEPDLWDLGDGIGWARDLEAAPRYVDLLHATASVLRVEAPGALVVAPALSSGPNARTAQLWRQIETTVFADGAAVDDVDVVSVHQNVLDGDDVGQWLVRLLSRKLYPLSAEAPRLAGKPIWLTELGWLSAEVGEAAQRRYLEQAFLYSTGAADWPRCEGIGNYRIAAGFVYKLEDSPDETSGLYRVDGTPKPAVTELLQRLAFPATVGATPGAELAASCDELDCTFRQASFTSGEGDGAGPWRCRWDFGDGESAEGCSAVHRYRRRGVYLVGLSMELPPLRLDGARWLTASCADHPPPDRRRPLASAG